MLVPLINVPRDYAWGSTILLAKLEGRRPTGIPEAEVWFGDHPGGPSETPDGTPLNAGGLPFLLKLLAAGSALSIQAHPSKTQAEAGYGREEAAGIPRDAADRTYRDANHKPELLVSLSDQFRALAGFRDIAISRRLVTGLGPGAGALADRLQSVGPSLAPLVGWALSPDTRQDMQQVIYAALDAASNEFSAELALVHELNSQHPKDPGIVVALLMNLVTLKQGEGLFVPAGIPHAYLEGLGVEVMAASDNVLRGGLTRKHIDVGELLAVLDGIPASPTLVSAITVADGWERFEVPVDDFTLLRVTAASGASRTVPVSGPAIALCVEGSLALSGADSVTLSPGGAVFISPAEGAVTVTGRGQAYLALGKSAGAPAPHAKAGDA
ncbi:mannose-6-phosphate isomerase, class I [Microbacterium sp. HJ5]